MKTHGYGYLLGSEIIAIINWMHYEVLGTLAPKAKNYTKPGKTVLLETNLLSSQSLLIDEVNFPESCTLPNDFPP